MFKWLKNLFKFQDVPEKDLFCESCREVDCTEEKWRTCQTRLIMTEMVARGKRKESED